ncbi:MAG: SufE family protein [Parachlamydiales bacterium]|nr:SufE family protein [Parachlamydiales bacterium]
MDNFQKKIDQIVSLFNSKETLDEKYHQLIELGKKAPLFEECYKTQENLINGCQSIAYLYSQFCNGTLLFKGWSDALISNGITALLVTIYSHETPKKIIESPPLFVQKLGIEDALSQNRANGLLYLYQRMKEDATQYLPPSSC